MASSVEIIVLVDHLDELIKHLPLLADAAAGKVADLIARDAQGRAPVKTGYMRDHIEVSRSGEASYDITSGAPYSGFVENGTRFMAARPFLLPAAISAASELEHIFVEAGKALP